MRSRRSSRGYEIERGFGSAAAPAFDQVGIARTLAASGAAVAVNDIVPERARAVAAWEVRLVQDAQLGEVAACARAAGPAKG